MKFTIVLTTLVTAVTTLHASAYAADLNTPIAIHSAADLDAFEQSLARGGSAEVYGTDFSDAVLYIESYVNRIYDPTASSDFKERFLVALVGGRTPREIIILGNLVRSEYLLRQIADEKLEAQGGRGAGNSQSYETDMIWEIGHERLARETIKRYMPFSDRK
jgi:hypothetical protein